MRINKRRIERALSKRVKVYSHPRSGTHYLEAFLARNFYKNEDLHSSPVVWGHWSNIKHNENGNPYGKLFGSHSFPNIRRIIDPRPMIYVYRDGRAVAYSIWKTNNFINPKYSGLDFSSFLRLKLDWKGSPSVKSSATMNVIEHWYSHVRSWHSIAKPNLIFVAYEELKRSPCAVFERIETRFFPILRLKRVARRRSVKSIIDKVESPVGLLPNKAKIDSWKSEFSKEDERYFMSIVKNRAYLFDD